MLSDRGNLDQKWLQERWLSLHLLTLIWIARLPGLALAGAQPADFMHKHCHGILALPMSKLQRAGHFVHIHSISIPIQIGIQGDDASLDLV